jgi:septal ring factor EnvC (AmiA/AmiB activator)
MRRAFPALLVSLGLASLSASAFAAPAPNVTALRGELQAKTQAREDARAQAEDLKQEIARLDGQLGDLRVVTATGEKGVGDKRMRLDALNARETALRAEMGRNQAALAGLLGALELYRRDPPPALLVSPRSAEAAVRAAILVRAIEPELNRRSAELRARAEELQRVRRGITSASEDLFTSESALADARAKLERTIREKTALERQLEADAVDAGRRAEALTQTLHALGIATDARSLAAAGSGRGPSRLLPPAEGAMVRRFGQNSPGGQTSDGLVWRTGPGAAVRAPAAGVVEYSGPLKSWGGVLILNVGGGYHLVLAGLDKMATASGRSVDAGQMIGAMPQGGTPELYLEVRRDGAPQPQDPARWFRSPPHAPAGGRG